MNSNLYKLTLLVLFAYILLFLFCPFIFSIRIFVISYSLFINYVWNAPIIVCIRSSYILFSVYLYNHFDFVDFFFVCVIWISVYVYLYDYGYVVWFKNYFNLIIWLKKFSVSSFILFQFMRDHAY